MITLEQLETELTNMLPLFKDGSWRSASFERDGVVFMKLTSDSHGHEYHANMAEDNRSVADILRVMGNY